MTRPVTEPVRVPGCPGTAHTGAPAGRGVQQGVGRARTRGARPSRGAAAVQLRHSAEQALSRTVGGTVPDPVWGPGLPGPCTGPGRGSKESGRTRTRCARPRGLPIRTSFACQKPLPGLLDHPVGFVVHPPGSRGSLSRRLPGGAPLRVDTKQPELNVIFFGGPPLDGSIPGISVQPLPMTSTRRQAGVGHRRSHETCRAYAPAGRGVQGVRRARMRGARPSRGAAAVRLRHSAGQALSGTVGGTAPDPVRGPGLPGPCTGPGRRSKEPGRTRTRRARPRGPPIRTSFACQKLWTAEAYVGVRQPSCAYPLYRSPEPSGLPAVHPRRLLPEDRRSLRMSVGLIPTASQRVARHRDRGVKTHTLRLLGAGRLGLVAKA